MTKRRVVVTGVGPITPIGIGKDEFWGNLTAGKSGIGMITQFDTTDFNDKIAGEVQDFDFGQYGGNFLFLLTKRHGFCQNQRNGDRDLRASDRAQF